MNCPTLKKKKKKSNLSHDTNKPYNEACANNIRICMKKMQVFYCFIVSEWRLVHIHPSSARR